MSGIILVCERDPGASRYSVDDLRRCAEHLEPVNIVPSAPQIHQTAGVIVGIVNPLPIVRVTPRGVCLGTLFDDTGWERLGSQPPDGTYVIARFDDSTVELVTDVFASRTVWYLHTQDAFIASTSQRAIVALTGRYEPCRETVSWLLAAGNLGPDHGWDARLRRVPSRTRLRLDRRGWTLSSQADTLIYEPRDLSPEDHLARLWESISSVCASLDTEHHPMTLTLSGGCDSRSLLVGLADAGKSVRCATWGLAESLKDAANDAAIARRLAERFGMEHDYHVLDFGAVPVREVFSRFLRAGEGRIEDFSGYTDGFRAWERLVDGGTEVIVRGDCPGWGSPYPPVSETVARSINMHCTLVSDYPEAELIHKLDLEAQRSPVEFSQRVGESLDDYRDRLYNDYELPTCMSAMNDVKCAYLEVVNPLYGREVVRVATQLPQSLRHCRVGFERLVSTLVPDIPFSSNQADESPESFLRRPQMRAELLAELSSTAARRVLSEPALLKLVEALERPSTQIRSRLRSRVKAHVPSRLVRALRPEPRPHLTTARLAYRAYLASRMAAILEEDADLLSSATQQPMNLIGRHGSGEPWKGTDT